MAQEDLDIEGEGDPLTQPSFWHYVAVLPTWVAAACLFVMMAITFVDVILRSAFNNPFEYAAELTRIFMAVIVFASLPMVSWKSEHIVVDLLDPLFSKALARIRDIIIDLVAGIALLWTAKRVFELAERSRGRGLVTEYMGFPEHVIGFFVAAFTAITALVFLARSAGRIFVPSKVPSK
ncbi:MAG: TRAP transporter small permease subunit [Pseudomonadota bacterium]